MIVSFTYTRTKLIAQLLVTSPHISEIWLQARKMTVEKEQSKIVVQEGNNYEPIAWNDLKGISGYFRDIDKTTMTPAETDACYREFNMTQKVRLVVYGEKVDLNMNQLSKQILSQLVGYNVEAVWFDPQDIVREEIGEIKEIPLSPYTYIFAVDFLIEDTLQMDACLLDIDCSIEDLLVCRS